MNMRREAILWSIAIIAAIVLGLIVVWVAIMLAFRSPNLTQLYFVAARYRQDDYSAEGVNTAFLNPLDPSLEQEAIFEDQARSDLMLNLKYKLKAADQVIPTVGLPKSTNTPSLASTSTPARVSTNTAMPVSTNTPAQVSTKTSVAVSTNTALPLVTNTSVPISTNTPMPVSTNTAIPVPSNTAVSAPTNSPNPNKPPDKPDNPNKPPDKPDNPNKPPDKPDNPNKPPK